MNKSLIKLLIVTFSLTLFNCKNETSTFNDYKYADQENILVCNGLDTKLYFEALVSFEDDMTDKYDPSTKNLRRGYSFFTRDALAGKVNFQEIVSPHTMKVFEALKKDTDLWNQDNSINYNSKLLTCIGNNFRNNDLKATFHALVSTNSMRSDIFGPPLVKFVKNSHEDRYMAAFVAFDLFYANLFNVDPTKVKEKEQVSNTNQPNANNAVKK
ncbi:hypothetical protein OS188_04430 [Xanthomarina sp. F1114]|uniref:hypothetical protein n=1 Tax=Xanthomarina sp. F1114 TaxID=2996019 RepID=UPI00225E6474|nr:hypothetical protein [Xanthomarina sp. F1114]MCX7547195.1 hypothetical protein [Xanthomarina sp. F1114]